MQRKQREKPRGPRRLTRLQPRRISTRSEKRRRRRRQPKRRGPPFRAHRRARAEPLIRARLPRSKPSPSCRRRRWPTPTRRKLREPHADAERAAADDKAWKARAAAQAAADKVAAARAAAKAAPTDGDAGAAYFNALSAARAAADAAAAAKAEADACGTRTLPRRPIARRATHRKGEAPIRDDGEDPDDPFADLNEAALGYWDDDPAPVPVPLRPGRLGFDDEPAPTPMTGGPEDRMVIDDVDHTPAPAAGPNAAAKSGTSKSDPPRTQERPGTSGAVKSAADAALMRAAVEWIAEKALHGKTPKRRRRLRMSRW